MSEDNKIRYYKGIRACKIIFRPEKHNKQIIEFFDNNEQVTTLVRLCWRNKRK